MTSELELLRQRITELEAKNVKLEAENAVIPELRKKLVELERENEKLRKELESRIDDHESRLAKVEQGSSVERPQNVPSGVSTSYNTNTKSTCHLVNSKPESKSSEEIMQEKKLQYEN